VPLFSFFVKNTKAAAVEQEKLKPAIAKLIVDMELFFQF